MKTLLLSTLSRQLLLKGARFAELHPYDWLVWEAGTLQVPRGNNATTTTARRGFKAPLQPALGDPLCFALERSEVGATITIGRAEGNDIVLSDESISRHHCTLVRSAQGWVATAPLESVSFLLGREEVGYGHVVPVASGQVLTLGNLTVSLYSARGMLVRLASKLAKK